MQCTTQGSVLIPILCNVVYDDLLAMSVPPGIQLILFADNLETVNPVKGHLAIENLMNPVLEAIYIWLTPSSLEIALQKWEVEVFTQIGLYQPNVEN